MDNVNAHLHKIHISKENTWEKNAQDQHRKPL